MNWNEDLIAPMRSAIDLIFRDLLDDSCDRLGAEAAQIAKDALSGLDNTLKGNQNMASYGSVLTRILRRSTSLGCRCVRDMLRAKQGSV